MKLQDYLDKDEIRHFSARSDVKAAVLVFFNWSFIAAIFYSVAIWTNPLTIVLAIIFLGGRQLGLGILMHEAGHRNLFQTRRLNEIVGQWLCAYPLLSDANVYAQSHKQHHRHAGSKEDPDLPNYQSYPVSRASFKRKLWRDITGQTGIKLLMGIFSGGGDIMVRGESNASHLPQALLVNVSLLAILALLGVGELYLLWVVAFLTTYPLFARIRQIAEHGAVTDLFDLDPRRHTRTTLANAIERCLFCPNYVNYHAEHHFAPSVPGYQLAALHRLLMSKGFYQANPDALARGYRDVLSKAVY